MSVIERVRAAVLARREEPKREWIIQMGEDAYKQYADELCALAIKAGAGGSPVFDALMYDTYPVVMVTESPVRDKEYDPDMIRVAWRYNHDACQ